MSAPQPLSEPQRLRILKSHHHLGRRDMVRFWQLSEEDVVVAEEFLDLDEVHAASRSRVVARMAWGV